MSDANVDPTTAPTDESKYAPGHTTNARLEARQADIGYGGDPIIPQIDAAIPEGEFTVIVGPNGCGKSTLLRAFARMLKPEAGEILLDRDPIGSYKPKEVARRLSL